MSELTDTLDQAIDRIRRGEDLEIILADHPPQANDLGPVLAAAMALDVLRPVPMPAPNSLTNDRNLFLTELVQLSQPTVSGGPLMRLKEWIAHYSLPKSIQFTIFKEQRRMNTLLIKATLVLVLLFGSIGGAAVASADSLPGRPLYPVKIIVEDTWLALTADPADQAALHLNFAQERLKEIEQLALGGETVPQATLGRFQLHLNQTLHLAAQAPDEAMLGLLTQIRQMAQNQEQILAKTQAQVTQSSQESLHQAGTALKQAGQQAEIGLKEPQTFRYRWQHAEEGNPEPPCDGTDCDPQHNQNQHQNQNQLSEPPGTPCTGDDCPGAPVQNQNQNQHQHQNQLSDPPGEPCSGDNCPGEPVQSQNQNQHQNQNQLSDPPGESCTGDNCPGEPVQNQNQNQHQNQLSDPPGEPCSGDDCPGTSVQNQNQDQNQQQGLDQEEIRDRERARLQEQSQDGSSAGPGDNGNGGSGNNGGNPDNSGSDNNSGNDDSGGNPDNSGNDDNGGSSDNGGGDDGGDSGSKGGNDSGNGGSGNSGGGNGGGGNGGGGGNK